MHQCHILLASQSPRRRELLTQIGVRFEVINVDVPELRGTNELPVAYVERLAREKSQAGFEMQTILDADNGVVDTNLSSEHISTRKKPVLGADTIVVLGEEVLEKPHNKAHAIEMLSRLSGKTHQVFTSVAMCNEKGIDQKTVSSWVSFGSLSREDILSYWKSGEPKGKAGAYAIQGFGATFIKSIEGSYSNVVGLPLYETAELLKKYQVPIGCSYIAGSLAADV